MTVTVKSLNVEVEHAGVSTTIILREPYGEGRAVYVAGPLSRRAAEVVLAELGLAPLRLLAASGTSELAPTSSGPVDSPRLGSQPGPRLEESSSVGSAPRVSREPTALLLEELAHAVLRAGRLHPTSTVDELLGRAWLAAANDIPLARVLSRLEEGLSPSGSAMQTALALTALGELAASPRPSSSEPASSRPVLAGPFETCELLELGRRRERGALGVETRILVDLVSGELVCEASARGGCPPSRGPVGRHVFVTFGQRTPCTGFSRMHIQHYEYDPAPSPERLDHVCHLASPNLPALALAGLELVCEPRPVFVRARSLEGGSPRVTCVGGDSVQLDDGCCPGLVQALFEQLREGTRADALVGTLELFRRSSAETGLVFVPWSVLLEKDGQRRLLPLSY